MAVVVEYSFLCQYVVLLVRFCHFSTSLPAVLCTSCTVRCAPQQCTNPLRVLCVRSARGIAVKECSASTTACLKHGHMAPRRVEVRACAGPREYAGPPAAARCSHAARAPSARIAAALLRALEPERWSQSAGAQCLGCSRGVLDSF